jgi:two-component system phosphate regulon sensor histidine kinase PhoR
MYYYALRADQGADPVGLVRTALPIDSVHQRMASVRRAVWFTCGMASLAVLVTTYWVVARIISPVTTLTHAAEAIAVGDYRQRVQVPNRDELGRLAATFNRMSQQMGEREAQLRHTAARFSTVLSGMVEGMIAVDDTNRVLLANAAAGRLFGFDAAEVQGRPLLETIRNHTLYEAVATALSSDRAADDGGYRVEVKTTGTDSHILAVRANRLPGQPCPGVVLVLHDVTELRRLEMVRQQFAANVSHELKTPLSSIKAYAETLLAGAINDPENNLRFVQQIEEQADRLHQLILDMLSLTRIESGEARFDITPVSLPDTVATCVGDYQDAAAAKDISLRVSPNQPHLRVLADEEGLREVVGNLLDNAIKYTPPEGQVTVRWQVENSTAVLEIQDTGIGISEDEQSRVFERFYRVDRARSREVGSTGLGLSIVKHLTQAFGGSVGLVSQPGQGSTFLVRLPRDTQVSPTTSGLLPDP